MFEWPLIISLNERSCYADCIFAYFVLSSCKQKRGRISSAKHTHVHIGGEQPNKKREKCTHAHSVLLCKFVFLLSRVILHDVTFCPHCYHFEKLHRRAAAFIPGRGALEKLPATPKIWKQEREKFIPLVKIVILFAGRVLFPLDKASFCLYLSMYLTSQLSCFTECFH